MAVSLERLRQARERPPVLYYRGAKSWQLNALE
jgi:hypothetical protein